VNTFNSTYSFLVAALLNEAGTTDTTVSENTDPGQGKTPQALQMVANREASRDNWDRFMMEEALEEVMKKMVNLTANGIDKDIELRLFAKEIEDIKKVYPDVVEMLDGSERGVVKISKKEFADTKFDYEITKGSTYKVDIAKELQNITQIFQTTIQNYDLIQKSLSEKGKMVDIGELYQRLVIGSGTQDWEKIIVDMPADQMQPGNPMDQMGMDPNQMAMDPMNQGMNPGMNPAGQQPGIPQYQDPDVAAFAQQIFQ